MRCSPSQAGKPFPCKIQNLLLSTAMRINLDYYSNFLIKTGDLLIKLELPAA